MNEQQDKPQYTIWQLAKDIGDIKKYLLGNGRPGALDRITELEVKLRELEVQLKQLNLKLSSSDVGRRLNTVEVQQKDCPARNAAQTENKAYKVQIAATIITAISAAAIVLKTFM